MDELGVCHPTWWEMGRKGVQESAGHTERFSKASQGQRDGAGGVSFKNLDFILRIMRNLLQGFKWRSDPRDLDSRKITQGRDWI